MGLLGCAYMRTVNEHFGLNEDPFRLSPDPRFLYLSPQVQEALAKCRYMVEGRVGPLYIYGPIGSGKTSILKRLRQEFSDNDTFNVAQIISANTKTSNAFLRVIMDEFGVKTARAYDQSLKNFNQFLLDEYSDGRVPLLLVDEAQNMNLDTLRLIHYLLNFETSREKLLQIVLVGQDQLRARVTRYHELASRMFPIAMNAHSPTELRNMVEFRWTVAGGGESPYDVRAYETIFRHSKGLPRDAVKICGESLRHMLGHKKTTISATEMLEVARSLNLAE